MISADLAGSGWNVPGVKYNRFQPITDVIWKNLREHFTQKQCMEISFTVGLDQLVSRFHATVQTDLDSVTTDQLTGSCPVALPPPPG